MLWLIGINHNNQLILAFRLCMMLHWRKYNFRLKKKPYFKVLQKIFCWRSIEIIRIDRKKCLLQFYKKPVKYYSLQRYSNTFQNSNFGTINTSNGKNNFKVSIISSRSWRLQANLIIFYRSYVKRLTIAIKLNSRSATRWKNWRYSGCGHWHHKNTLTSVPKIKNSP
jgi:hypothetical protein